MNEQELTLKPKRDERGGIETGPPVSGPIIRGSPGGRRRHDEPSILSIIDRSLSSGELTAEKVTITERLIDMKLKVDAIEAEKAFAKAFNELLADMPQIEATKAVPNNDGSVRYRFTPIEEIDTQLRPVALRHGFSFWFE